MEYLNLKALHIIFVVTWFAGLFYQVRLFIYQTEALHKNEPEKSIVSKQLALMSRRLWLIITWPSAILTLIFGTSLLISQPAWLKQPFMHVKLGLVFLLFIYQLVCQRLYVRLQKGRISWTSTQLRIWNEVATLFLVAIVFLIVLKSEIDWIWGTLGLIGFAILLMLAIRLYKKLRKE